MTAGRFNVFEVWRSDEAGVWRGPVYKRRRRRRRRLGFGGWCRSIRGGGGGGSGEREGERKEDRGERGSG